MTIEEIEEFYTQSFAKQDTKDQRRKDMHKMSRPSRQRKVTQARGGRR